MLCYEWSEKEVVFLSLYCPWLHYDDIPSSSSSDIGVLMRPAGRLQDVTHSVLRRDPANSKSNEAFKRTNFHFIEFMFHMMAVVAISGDILSWIF